MDLSLQPEYKQLSLLPKIFVIVVHEEILIEIIITIIIVFKRFISLMTVYVIQQIRKRTISGC